MSALPGFEVEQQDSEAAREEAIRRAFEERRDVGWMDDYSQLRDEGWSWREAAYIAWRAQPVEGRWPKTQGELATEVLGLTSDRAIRNWKAKNPAIEEAISDLLVTSLLAARSDVIGALKEVAASAKPAAHRDRRMYLEMVGLYEPKSTVKLGPTTEDDLDSLSDEELRALAAKAKGKSG